MKQALPLLAFVDLSSLGELSVGDRPVRIPAAAMPTLEQAGGVLAAAHRRAAAIEREAREKCARECSALTAQLEAIRHTYEAELAEARNAAAEMLLTACRDAVTTTVVEATAGLLNDADRTTRAAMLVRALIGREGARLTDAILTLEEGVRVTELPGLPAGWIVRCDPDQPSGKAYLDMESGRLLSEFAQPTAMHPDKFREMPEAVSNNEGFLALGDTARVGTD